MKRIVALLMPVAERDIDSSRSESAQEPQVRKLPASQEGPHLPRDSAGLAGVLQIEAIVTEAQAQRLVDSLLDGESPAPTGSTIEQLLHTELQVAGDEADDLLDRIVGGVERQLIELVYDSCGHVKTETARRLGIHRNTLDKKLRFYRLDLPHSP